MWIKSTSPGVNSLSKGLEYLQSLKTNLCQEGKRQVHSWWFSGYHWSVRHTSFQLVSNLHQWLSSETLHPHLLPHVEEYSRSNNKKLSKSRWCKAAAYAGNFGSSQWDRSSKRLWCWSYKEWRKQKGRKINWHNGSTSTWSICFWWIWLDRHLSWGCLWADWSQNWRDLNVEKDTFCVRLFGHDSSILI